MQPFPRSQKMQCRFFASRRRAAQLRTRLPRDVAREVRHAHERVMQRAQFADGSGVAVIELLDAVLQSAASGDRAAGEEERTSLRVDSIEADTAADARRTSSRRRTPQTAAPVVAPRVKARALARSAILFARRVGDRAEGWAVGERVRSGGLMSFHGRVLCAL